MIDSLLFNGSALSTGLSLFLLLLFLSVLHSMIGYEDRTYME